MDIYDFGFRRGSQDWEIARCLLDGKTREETIKKLFPEVAKNNPFIYQENVGFGRRPKPRMEQYRLFLYTVNRTIQKMKAEGWEYSEGYLEKRQWESKERKWVRFRREFIEDMIKEGLNDPAEDEEVNPLVAERVKKPGVFIPKPPEGFVNVDADEGEDIDGDDYEDAEEEKEEIEPPPPSEKDQYGNVVVDYIFDEKARKYDRVEYEPEITTENELDFFFKSMMRARAFVLQRELGGEFLDFISTRAIKDGCKAIISGIDSKEVLEAVTKTWPEDSKNEFERWSTEWTPKTNDKINYNNYENPLPGSHRYLGYVIRLAHARIPIFLVGPSGCGKSFLARDLADALEMNYGELPLTAGATPSWLVGAETITGYKSRPFVEIYRHGGIFCFEEMDAADPNMLLLVNNALANEALTNPVTGEEIPKHSDFIAVATANTWGLGANRQFTGRERLDAATLDRWRVGRIELDYDQSIEKNILEYYKREANHEEKPHKVKKAVKAK